MNDDPQGFHPTEPKPQRNRKYTIYRKVLTLRIAPDGTVDTTINTEGWVDVDESAVRKFFNLPPN